MLAALGTPSVQATEGGGSIYPNGVENCMAGALPPPGMYGIVYGNSYSADRINDANGNSLNIPGFHHSPNLHSIVALDVILPTGGYKQGDLANIGRHYTAFDPVLAVTQVDPNGLNADIKLGYLINQRNSATGYQSGQEFHFDYSIGWGLGSGWTAGAGGYYYQQATSDKLNGQTQLDSKGKALAIGPSVKYDSGKGWFVTVKWQKETSVENRAQGSALWLKAVFPL